MPRRWLTAALVALPPLCGCGDDGTTLTFWAMGQEGERVAEVLAPFLAEHPEIRIKIQVIPWGAAHDKLLTAYAGRATPDVCQLGNTWVTEFHAMRALAPLDPWIDRSAHVDRGDYFEGVWQSNVIEGQVWGLPWYVDTRALYYRTDLFAAAGQPHAPETWDELAAAARAATRDTDGDGDTDRFGISLPPNPSGSPIPLFFAWQNGADLLDASMERPAVETPAFAEALAHYVGFFASGAAPREVGALTNFHQAFAEGAFASFVSGPWEMKTLRDKVPAIEGKWAVAPLPPKVSGGPRTSLAGGSSLVIFDRARRPEQAWALVEYLSRPDVQVAFWRATQDLPARRSAWEHDSLRGDPNVRAFYTQLEHARSPPQVPEWEQLADRLAAWTERAVYGEVTPEAAMRGLAKDADRILEKRRWLRARKETP